MITLQYPTPQTAKNNPLPPVTCVTLETVKQACAACEDQNADVFFTCLRNHGASGVMVAAVIGKVLPNLADHEAVTAKQLLEAIERYDSVAQAA